MDMELFDALEARVENLLKQFSSLKQENLLLKEENLTLMQEREVFKSRIDAILKKMEGM
ncbi:MAG: cell division protein ZapB [Geobacteraceae bacterium]|nr:cell division protein ZapB [Geobacteraceae bacterium]